MKVVFWWWAFNLKVLDEWSFLPYLVILLEPSLLCLAGAILHPTSMAPDLDFKAHFHASRRVFFSVFLLVSVTDLILVLFAAPSGHFSTLGAPYLAFFIMTIIGCTVAAVVENDRFHGVFSVAYGIVLFNFIFFTQATIPA